MDDPRRAVGGQALGQPGNQPVHRGVARTVGFGILPRPARHLPGEVIARPAIIAQTHRQWIDAVEHGQRVDLGIIDGAPFRRTGIGQATVPQYAALDHVHDIEGRTDDRFVLAQRIGTRHRKVGLAERMDDAEFAVHGMGRCQQLTGRLAAQHIAPGGGAQLIGRVGLAAGETQHFERAGEPLDRPVHPVAEPYGIQIVRWSWGLVLHGVDYRR